MNSFSMWSILKVLASDEEIRAPMATNQVEEVTCGFFNIMKNVWKVAWKMTGGDGSAKPPPP